MSEFRITIANNVMAGHPRKVWQRMTEYIEREAPTITGHDNFAEDSWTYWGEATSHVITVLQAAAQGHDLGKVLDLIEAKESRVD